MDILDSFNIEEKLHRNPHSSDESWWDGPERFEYVNRNVVSKIQNEDLFKFIKILAPSKIGLNIGGLLKSGKRSNYCDEKPTYTKLLNIIEPCDIIARAEKLPFEDNSIGYIVSFHTLEHISGDIKDILSEWVRVLVPGGLIGISMPDKRYFLHDSNNTKDGVYAYNEMSPDELITICKELNNVKVLLFDDRKNNFDFDLIIRKICHPG